MRNLPKLLKQYYGPMDRVEELILVAVWAQFRRKVISKEWIALPFELQLADCTDVLGTLFKVPMDDWYLFVEKRDLSQKAKAERAQRALDKSLAKELKQKQQAEARANKLARDMNALAHKVYTQFQKGKNRKKSKKKGSKPASSSSPKIILRKHSTGTDSNGT